MMCASFIWRQRERATQEQIAQAEKRTSGSSGGGGEKQMELEINVQRTEKVKETGGWG